MATPSGLITPKDLDAYLRNLNPQEDFEFPEARTPMPIIGGVIQWIRESEDRGTLCKVLTYATSFFLSILLMASIVGIPLFILGLRELVAQNEEAEIFADINRIYDKNKPVKKDFADTDARNAADFGLRFGMRQQLAKDETLFNNKIEHLKNNHEIEVAALLKKCDTASKENDALKVQNRGLTKEVKLRAQETSGNPDEEKLQQAIADGRQNYENALQAINTLETKLTTADMNNQQTVSDLKKELEVVKASETQKTKLLEEFRNEKEQLLKKHKALTDLQTELQQKLQAEVEGSQAQQEQLKAMEKQIEQLMQSNAMLMEKNTRLNTETLQLAKELIEVKKQVILDTEAAKKQSGVVNRTPTPPLGLNDGQAKGLLDALNNLNLK